MGLDPLGWGQSVEEGNGEDENDKVIDFPNSRKEEIGDQVVGREEIEKREERDEFQNPRDLRVTEQLGEENYLIQGKPAGNLALDCFVGHEVYNIPANFLAV